MAKTEGAVLIFATQLDSEKPPDSWLRVRVDRPRQLACGHFHYLALDARGAVYSWGRGPLGVLGHSGEDDEPKERLVEALEGQTIDYIAAGPYQSAALTRQGRLYTWGWMPFSMSADGVMEETFSHVPRPTKLPGAVPVRGLACGCFATAAWDDHGQLFTWGRGDSGQLGHGNGEPVASPKSVEALAGVRVTQVAFGGVQTANGPTGFMLVRSESGLIFSCGSPERGRLGRPYVLEEPMASSGSGPVHHAVPGEVSLGPNGDLLCSCVAAGDNHAIAITSEGGCYVWGANEGGVLALPEEDGDATEPIEVDGLPCVTKAVCATHSSALVADDGALLLLGGDPSTPEKPRLAGLPGRIAAVFGGGFHIGVLLEHVAPSDAQSPTAAETSSLAAHATAADAPPSGGRRGEGGGGASGSNGSSSYSSSYSSDTASDSQTGAGAPAERRPPQLATPALLKESDDYASAVAPELAELLLSDPAGTPPLQLRHELRLLRDLLAAERAKLQGLTAAQKRVEAEHQVALHPADDTWTQKEVVRGESDEPSVTSTVILGAASESPGGTMHLARTSSVLSERRAHQMSTEAYRGRPLF